MPNRSGRAARIGLEPAAAQTRSTPQTRKRKHEPASDVVVPVEVPKAKHRKDKQARPAGQTTRSGAASHEAGAAHAFSAQAPASLKVHQCSFIDWDVHSVARMACTARKVRTEHGTEQLVAVARANGDLELRTSRLAYHVCWYMSGDASNPVTALSFPPASAEAGQCAVSALLWVARLDGSLTLLALDAELQYFQLMQIHPGGGAIWCMCAIDTYVLLGCEDGCVRAVSLFDDEDYRAHAEVAVTNNAPEARKNAWSLAPLQTRMSVPGQSRVVSLASDGQVVFAGDCSGTIRKLDARSLSTVASMAVSGRHPDTVVWCLVLIQNEAHYNRPHAVLSSDISSPASHHAQLLSGDSRGIVSVWDVATATNEAELQIENLAGDILCMAHVPSRHAEGCASIFVGAANGGVALMQQKQLRSSHWVAQRARGLHTGDVRVLVYAQGVKRVLCAGNDRSVSMFSPSKFMLNEPVVRLFPWASPGKAAPAYVPAMPGDIVDGKSNHSTVEDPVHRARGLRQSLLVAHTDASVDVWQLSVNREPERLLTLRPAGGGLSGNICCAALLPGSNTEMNSSRDPAQALMPAGPLSLPHQLLVISAMSGLRVYKLTFVHKHIIEVEPLEWKEQRHQLSSDQLPAIKCAFSIRNDARAASTQIACVSERGDFVYILRVDGAHAWIETRLDWFDILRESAVRDGGVASTRSADSDEDDSDDASANAGAATSASFITAAVAADGVQGMSDEGGLAELFLGDSAGNVVGLRFSHANVDDSRIRHRVVWSSSGSQHAKSYITSMALQKDEHKQRLAIITSPLQVITYDFASGSGQRGAVSLTRPEISLPGCYSAPAHALRKQWGNSYPVTGTLFLSANRLLLQGLACVCILTLSGSDSVVRDDESRHKGKVLMRHVLGRSGAAAAHDNEHINVIGVGLLAPDHIVAVTKSWIDMLAMLPDVIPRKVFREA
ncbi:hypothetical protein FVE85_5061 [Porphyridium purpureum]|uniref:U3 small nucleolar RNA-associated protein 4 n=1 Tax=Porphyridium purpureum TaxID=35688 RepID=A0A5J4Z1H8_PORPP|nr:hypothetical protein FVE85_5061 [Porphyridium purpureum]|eukprot:POR3715..scf295_1